MGIVCPLLRLILFKGTEEWEQADKLPFQCVAQLTQKVPEATVQEGFLTV